MTFLTLGISKTPVLDWKNKNLHVDKHVLCIQYIACLSFPSFGDIPNALRFQEDYFLIWNPMKDCFSDSWILKTQANPIRWMVSIIIVESIESNKTFVSTFKRVRTKFQTSNVKFRLVKANCLEQKWIISWFQRPQMGGCVFFGRTDGRSVTIFLSIRPVCSRLRRPQAAAFGGIN